MVSSRDFGQNGDEGNVNSPLNYELQELYVLNLQIFARKQTFDRIFFTPRNSP